jgi:elongation factor Ts
MRRANPGPEADAGVETRRRAEEMATISAADVKNLRDQTGAGMMDCKRALSDADGDLERAMDLLRERGLGKAGKPSERETSEGLVAVAQEGGTAGIVELGCETDFVARTDEYQALGAEIAGVVAGDASITGVDHALKAALGDGTVEDRITAAIAKMGENIELKRVERLSASSGVVGGYVHAGGKLGVAVLLETSASGAAVDGIAKDVAMHVAAADPVPLSVGRDDLDAAVLEKERKILTAQAQQSGKPEGVIEKMVEGRLRKFFGENCLLEQAFVKDPDQSVGDVIAAVAKEAGSEIKVAGFARFRVGEESGG